MSAAGMATAASNPPKVKAGTEKIRSLVVMAVMMVTVMRDRNTLN